MQETNFDVIVVGAGFGGSACAALLAKRGLRVLLLDKNTKAGGKAMSLSKRGFTYTAWVVITAPAEGNPFEKVSRSRWASRGRSSWSNPRAAAEDSRTPPASGPIPPMVASAIQTS